MRRSHRQELNGMLTGLFAFFDADFMPLTFGLGLLGGYRDSAARFQTAARR